MKRIFETLSEAFEFVDTLGPTAKYQVIRYGNCAVVKIW